MAVAIENMRKHIGHLHKVVKLYVNQDLAGKLFPLVQNSDGSWSVWIIDFEGYPKISNRRGHHSFITCSSTIEEGFTLF